MTGPGAAHSENTAEALVLAKIRPDAGVYALLCMLGKTVTIEKKYKAVYAGTPSYHIKGNDKRVRRSEVVLPRKKK